MQKQPNIQRFTFVAGLLAFGKSLLKNRNNTVQSSSLTFGKFAIRQPLVHVACRGVCPQGSVPFQTRLSHRFHSHEAKGSLSVPRGSISVIVLFSIHFFPLPPTHVYPNCLWETPTLKGHIRNLAIMRRHSRDRLRPNFSRFFPQPGHSGS